ncbi:hypothetical protein ACFLRB_01190 [Acidobacteriota bacterium]
MKKFKRLLSAILFLSSTFLFYGQQLTYDGKGITLMITPEQVRLGGETLISGAAAPGRGSRTMTAVFKHPNGSTYTRNFQMEPDGTYQYSEKNLDSTGTWEVTVKGPVIKEMARGSFEVLYPTGAAVVSVQILQQGLGKSLELLTELQIQTANFPKLPEKDQAVAQMKELETTLNRMKSDWDRVSDALDQLNTAIPGLSPFPETQIVMNQLADNLQLREKQMQPVIRELELAYEEVNNTREWCRMWFAQKKGLKMFFKAVETIFTGGKGLAVWAGNILEGYVKGVWKQLTLDSSQAVLNLTEEQKKEAEKALGKVELADTVIQNVFGENGSILEIKKKAAFVSIDYLIEWISGVVAKNCRVYNAKVNGKLTINFYTKGAVYMVAKYRFEGGMELFFQKRRNKNDIVRLQGQIWGNFDWRIGQFFPERVAGDIPGVWAFGMCVPRPPFPGFRDFFLVLEGEGKPEEVEIEVKKTSYDKEKLKYRYISVIWSPYQLVPALDFPETSIPGGHWFVTRATKTAGKEKKFRIPLTIDGKKTILKHVFERTMDYRKQSEFIAKLELKIDGKEDGI